MTSAKGIMPSGVLRRSPISVRNGRVNPTVALCKLTSLETSTFDTGLPESPVAPNARTMSKVFRRETRLVGRTLEGLSALLVVAGLAVLGVALASDMVRTSRGGD